jgi:GIY-YIG catalytic domain
MAAVTHLRRSLACVAKDAKDWFWSATTEKTRDEYFAKGKLGDDGSGAVYAYLDENNKALYIGEAGRPIKRRMHDEKSPHKHANWWECWKKVRFLQMPCRTDRLALELLLILACKPPYNTKPGPRDYRVMFGN